MILRVVKPGPFTTVQDFGRYGYQDVGVPVCGAMDTFALAVGNAMLGNEIGRALSPGAAALEATIRGPEIAVESGSGCVVAAGGDLGLRVNGTPVDSFVCKRVERGDVLSFVPGTPGENARRSARTLLCVSGGIDVPLVMGSRSTYARASLGGVEGRALRAGDRLTTGEPDLLWELSDGFALEESNAPLGKALVESSLHRRTLDVVMGMQCDRFTEKAIETFFGSPYTVSADSDRMGIRFIGKAVEHRGGADIVSDAICAGAVQIPGNGMPVAMAADRQTTGGYTKIGALAPHSVSALAYLSPGDEIRFVRASRERGVEELRERMRALEQIIMARTRFRARPRVPRVVAARGPKILRVRVLGRDYDVVWEEVF